MKPSLVFLDGIHPSPPTRVMEMKPWHYFNEAEDCCWFTSTITKERIPYVLCGKKATEVGRHTEDRAQVTCRRCLHMIVRMEVNYVSR